MKEEKKHSGRHFKSALSVFVGNVILIYLMFLVNHRLSSWGLFLYLGSLWVVVSVAYLNFFGGFACCALTGLFADIGFAFPWGTSIVLISITYIFGYMIFSKNGNKLDILSIGSIQSINILLLITLAMVLNPGPWVQGLYWVSWLIGIAISQLVLALVANWFLGFQKSLAFLFRVSLSGKEY